MKNIRDTMDLIFIIKFFGGDSYRRQKHKGFNIFFSNQRLTYGKKQNQICAERVAYKSHVTMIVIQEQFLYILNIKKLNILKGSYFIIFQFFTHPHPSYLPKDDATSQQQLFYYSKEHERGPSESVSQIIVIKLVGMFSWYEDSMNELLLIEGYINGVILKLKEVEDDCFNGANKI